MVTSHVKYPIAPLSRGLPRRNVREELSPELLSPRPDCQTCAIFPGFLINPGPHPRISCLGRFNCSLMSRIRGFPLHIAIFGWEAGRVGKQECLSWNPQRGPALFGAVPLKMGGSLDFKLHDCCKSRSEAPQASNLQDAFECTVVPAHNKQVSTRGQDMTKPTLPGTQSFQNVQSGRASPAGKRGNK